MIVTGILLSITIILFYIFYRTRKAQQIIFKKLGIPGPEPHFLFGNLLEFKKGAPYVKHQEWRKKYGPTFGYFEGPTPVLVTSDVNMLQEVFVKQFSNFHARKLWPVQVDPDKDEDVHMFFARGKRWKRLRRVVNPAFSSSRLKNLVPTVNDCINHLLDVIRDTSDAQKDKTLEIHELFRRLTLDTILRCQVGVDKNCVKNPQDPFLENCKGVIEDTTKMSWLYLLGFLFPNLHMIWINLYKFIHTFNFNPVYWLEDRMREVINMRRNVTETRAADLMQQMLDSRIGTDSFLELDDGFKLNASSSDKSTRLMTNEEIISHALLFLLAGYETTSTTLTYIFFELSQNPQVQERVRHEVMTILPRGYHKIDYDDLKKLTYLDYVIWETLRKYPLASTVTVRQCMRETTIGGLRIPAGMLVQANIWDVHYNPEHWGEDVHKFDPLRFTPDKRKMRHPAAWMPFGGGPRTCAGLRFALLQLKMVVAKVLRDFDFQVAETQQIPLNLRQGATILPDGGVRLTTLRRASAKADVIGLRRGSTIGGLQLPDWMSMRRSSVKEEESDTDANFPLPGDEGHSHSENDDNFDAKRNSISEALENQERAKIRRASINKGIEILTEDSINRGLSLLRRASVSSTLEDFEEAGGKEKELDLSWKLLTTDEESDKLHAFDGKPDTQEDTLGEIPCLKSRQFSRRGSNI